MTILSFRFLKFASVILVIIVYLIINILKSHNKILLIALQEWYGVRLGLHRYAALPNLSHHHFVYEGV